MGFININGQQVHTSNISIAGSANYATSSTYSSGSTLTYTSGPTISLSAISSIGNISKRVYNVLGEEVESTDYNPQLPISLALLNVLGKPFYDQLKLQGFSFSDEIQEVVDRKMKSVERDEKIKSILDK